MSNNKVSFDDEVKKAMADMLEHGLSAAAKKSRSQTDFGIFYAQYYIAIEPNRKK